MEDVNLKFCVFLQRFMFGTHLVIKQWNNNLDHPEMKGLAKRIISIEKFGTRKLVVTELFEGLLYLPAM